MEFNIEELIIKEISVKVDEYFNKNLKSIINKEIKNSKNLELIRKMINSELNNYFEINSLVSLIDLEKLNLQVTSKISEELLYRITTDNNHYNY